ncbi:hypothetical protein TSUD_324710 [Trifolium subterraneum]|uniref:Retrotransposon gag domain-containing protein n=1 Tax=Trifolium subterraneum TaxID=3900 RepID=A0A2Z6NWW5_TRISU|nr:hypothetical protein TSUD_324710 [Trifolium subterraneum]
MTNLRKIFFSIISIGVIISALFTNKAKATARLKDITDLNVRDGLRGFNPNHHIFLQSGNGYHIARLSPAGPDPHHHRSLQAGEVDPIVSLSPGYPDPHHHHSLKPDNVYHKARLSPKSPDPHHHRSLQSGNVYHIVRLSPAGTFSSGLLFDPEIEKTARANRKAVRQATEAERLLASLDQDFEEVQTNTEEEQIDMAEEEPNHPNTVINALKEDQYSGSKSQCLNLHLSHFYDACDYTDPPGISESDKRLRLFKFSLTGRAKDWLDTIPPGTIATWQELERKFKDRYFSIHKFLERRSEIMNFEQGDGETLYDAWERFKLCLKKCPDHGIDDLQQMQYFTQGLRPQTRMLLDASTSGSLKNKDEVEAKELIETMTNNEYRAQNDRGAKKKAGILELDTNSVILAQMKLVTSQMEERIQSYIKSTLDLDSDETLWKSESLHSERVQKLELFRSSKRIRMSARVQKLKDVQMPTRVKKLSASQELFR